MTSLMLLSAVLLADSGADYFETHVRPVLAKNCYACHTTSKMGGLALDSREGLLKGGNSGAAVVAGDPKSSLLLRVLRGEHERIKMPPSGPLKAEEIASLETWVKDGAVWPVSAAKVERDPKAFWSFQPVAAPKLRSLDAYVPKAGPRADKRTLLRRVTFDLVGLPPTPEEMDAFLKDSSKDAYAKVVDRLLASPHYGERWGRVWLDVARYSDDKLNSEFDDPRPNAYRYRDWVIQAFNNDMPYDVFVKAQIAGDQLGKPELVPGLGMYAMSPEFQDDRVDVTTRGFLGLTVACAQCHDHKFDPIPTRDFYSLQGIFNNSEVDEYALAPKPVVDEYKARKATLTEKQKELDTFLKAQADSLADILAHQAAGYLDAARGLRDAAGLDKGTLDRWKKYLARDRLEHPFLDKAPKAADFQKLLLDVNREKKEIDERNNITLGGSQKRDNLANADLASLERNKYFLWRDFFGDRGVLFYGPKDIDPYLGGPWKDHAAVLRAEVETAKKAVPPEYPFVYALKDKPKMDKMRVHIRGNAGNLGEEAPPEFLKVLSSDKRVEFKKPRLELAEAIANPANPLTARVFVNRLWLAHFGQGIVATPSNFGLMGERPTNPALLDYLAWKFLDGGWSVKKLQREIVMSEAYAAVRPTPQRLQAEQVRDAILFVSGALDLTVGGPAAKLDEKNKRRTVYGYVSRRKLDPVLTLFDFPNPNQTSERRLSTDVPLQRLFLLNSPLVAEASEKLSALAKSANDAERLVRLYRLVFERAPTAEEKKLGLAFVSSSEAKWPQLAQVLLASDEFMRVN